MKIAVIGGTGLIGSKTVAIPRRGGHEVIAASQRYQQQPPTGRSLIPDPPTEGLETP